MGFLGSIGKVFSSIAKFAIPIAEDLLTGGIGGLAKDIFSQLAKSVFSDGKTGGLFSNDLSLFGQHLPNPLSSLNGLVSGADSAIKGFANSPIGNILQDLLKMFGGNTTTNVGGTPVTRPPLQTSAADLGAAAGNVAAGLGAGVGTGGAIGGLGATGGVSGGISPQAYSEALSPQQQNVLNDPNLSPQEKSRMQAEFAMQNHQEVMEFISNMMKMMHDTQMAIIGNIR